jgi:hypothetical protein
MLYQARKMSNDDRFDDIVMFLPSNGEIWLCKKTVRLDAST